MSDPAIIDLTPDVRIERFAKANHDAAGNIVRDAAGNPVFTWKVYVRKSTGLVVHDDAPAGESLTPGVMIYSLAVIAKHGIHPIHGGETCVSHVWVPVFAGLYADAFAKATDLATRVK